MEEKETLTPEEQEDAEIENLLEEMEKEDQDPDEKKAEEMREKIAAIKKRKEEEEKAREAKKGQKPEGKPKGTKKLEKIKCANCGKLFKPRKAKQKNCSVPCAKEQAGKNGGRPELKQDEVQEKLGPFLRLWLTLKEACLEADLVYSTILDKKLEWEGFIDFIEKCENYVVIKARRAIFKKLDGTDNQAAITQRWVLKNKRPEEFWDGRRPGENPDGNTKRFAGIEIIVTTKTDDKKE